MRVTIQRKTILETLRRLHSHPTAEELYQLVKPALPRVSLATVYRNLELLASEGLIRKLTIQGSSQKRFDGNPYPHSHAQCLKCGKIEDIIMNPEFDPTSFIKESYGFEIQDYNIEFKGLCAECKAYQGETKSKPKQREGIRNGAKKSKRNKN